VATFKYTSAYSDIWSREIMMVKEITSIRISKHVKKQLDGVKIHHRETYEDVIRRLIQEHKGD